jgi:hypothetical protein
VYDLCDHGGPRKIGVAAPNTTLICSEHLREMEKKIAQLARVRVDVFVGHRGYYEFAANPEAFAKSKIQNMKCNGARGDNDGTVHPKLTRAVARKGKSKKDKGQSAVTRRSSNKMDHSSIAYDSSNDADAASDEDVGQDAINTVAHAGNNRAGLGNGGGGDMQESDAITSAGDNIAGQGAGFGGQEEVNVDTNGGSHSAGVGHIVDDHEKETDEFFARVGTGMIGEDG